MAGEADAILLIVLAFIFPPVAVAFVSGCGVDLCFNILLTMLGYLPGCIHALWIVYKRNEANERYGYRNWTYKGMGEYAPPDASQQQQREGQTYVQPQGPGTGPAPPPPGPPPAPSSAPAPAPAPTSVAGQQSDEKTPAYTQPLPPPAPVEKKYEYEAPPQTAPPTGGQKQANVEGDAPPAGTGGSGGT